MKISVPSVIESFVEALLPRFTKGKILHICIGASYDVYENGLQINSRTYVHLFFHRPYNYTKVFLVETNTPFIDICGNSIKLKLTSDHDSCWRSDGVQSPITQIHQRMVDKVEKKYSQKKTITCLDCRRLCCPFTQRLRLSRCMMVMF